MFCPDCGLEDKQSNQFCRACGSDLRRIRTALETPDSITSSAVAARAEIGRSIAARIRETSSAEELSTVAEEVLPEIEKFLESPEERRLRRMRVGTIISSIGLGAAIAMSIVAILSKDNDLFFLAALGVVTFFIGLGFVVNGMFLTVPQTGLTDRSDDALRQRELDGIRTPVGGLPMPDTNDLYPIPSVTEHTTKHLKSGQK
ncbi:MAG TPA: hypothetical protein VJL58_09745 [Pyrinomonadaceae bacterium]|nr:hypothetical protein [Pyrinomonadaceae bacterium]